MFILTTLFFYKRRLLTKPGCDNQIKRNIVTTFQYYDWNNGTKILNKKRKTRIFEKGKIIFNFLLYQYLVAKWNHNLPIYPGFNLAVECKRFWVRVFFSKFTRPLSRYFFCLEIFKLFFSKFTRIFSPFSRYFVWKFSNFFSRNLLEFLDHFRGIFCWQIY